MQEIPKRDRAGLRRFGLTTGTAFVVVFSLLLPWLIGFTMPLWPWLLAAVLWVWASIAPGTLGPLYHGWMRVALAIGRVTTPLLMAIVFYLVFAPVGVGMRLFGRDPLARERDEAAASYRLLRAAPVKHHMLRPF